MSIAARLAAPLAALALAAPAAASDAVEGEETTYRSPNGVTERCVRIAPMPGASYSKKDLAREKDYCAIDVHAPDVALCPKTWSTSPGTMIYDISSGPYAGQRVRFQRRACREGKSARALSAGLLAKFKPTVNARGTSGTFAPSSLLYYHFSRYFDMEAKVPVAVWRSIDRKAHREEVSLSGLSLSGGRHSGRMNHEGWRVLAAAEEKPSRYSPTDELFTADRTAVYGVMLRSPGRRYGPEVNGTRKSGWGKGQNLDFQKTVPYLALRAKKPLAEAIAEGMKQGRRDSRIARATPKDTPPQQIVYWMRELSEIVLLDFIFSQQDRVGNIDFQTYWYWTEDGALKRVKGDWHGPRPAGAPESAIQIRRTRLNDNDAGGRVQYANFAKSTGMLEKLRHFDAGVYRRLMALDADFQARGPLHDYVATGFGLSERQAAQIFANTKLAAGILREACARGDLIFDLDPKAFFLDGKATPEKVSCAG